ncbi:MAG: hypothetical protein CUN55_20880, partial [Phototrophicales bacterium]
QEARQRSGLLASGTFLVKQSAQFLLDLVFPPHCAGCGKVGSSWCQRCQQELSHHPIQYHFRELPPMSGVIATSPHEGKLQDAIHALKYYGAIDLAAPLAQRLIVCLEATEW